MSRTPVTVLTGFFGSGKSTLLARTLARRGRSDVAVVNNDFGETSYAHALASSGASLTDVTAGCICCSKASGLAAAVDQALSAAPAHVVVETSGISDPAPVLRTLLGDPAIAPRLRLGAVVATFDAVHGLAQLSRYPEARRQAALADRIVLTKCDVAAPAETAMLRDALLRAAPAVPVQQPDSSGIAPELLLKAGNHRAPPSGFVAHRADITAHAFTVDAPVTRDALALFMDLMAAYRGGAVLRLKGVLDVDGCPTEIQGVLQAFHPPLALDAWSDGLRRPGLVIVTDGLTRADLEPAIAALGFEPIRKGQMPSPATYARFRAIAASMIPKSGYRLSE